MSTKRKRNLLNIETKVEIIERLDKGESGYFLARFYNVGKSTIADIKRKKETILSFASKIDSTDGKRTRKVMKSAANIKLDEALFLWFVQQRNLGVPKSGPVLCEQALVFNSKMGGACDFKASSGWLKIFKSRHRTQYIGKNIITLFYICRESQGNIFDRDKTRRIHKKLYLQR